MNRTNALALVILSSLVISVGCSPSDPKNGTVVCGTAGKSCPDGYYCSTDSNTCWKNGTGPGGGSDAAPSTGRDASSTDTVIGASPEVLTDVKLAATDANADQSTAPRLDSRQLEDGSADLPGQPDSSADLPTSNDVAQGDVAPPADAVVLGPDSPVLGPDVAVKQDAPAEPDAPGCPSGKKACNGKCIDSAACCVASDCNGSCMTCDATNTCVAIKGQADPTGRCTGTCDSTGACKGKLGQSCTAVGGGCAAGTSCSPEGICCDKACTDSCEACDATGTCKPLTAGSSPKTGHAACTATDAACAGKCDGSSSACAYPASTCGAASCTGSVYQAAGTCQKGACAAPPTQTCPNACVVASGGCSGTCSPNAVQCSSTGVPQKCSSAGAWVNQTECQPGFACSGGSCTCSKTTCGNACVDLQTDGTNCGACGHSCQGGTCSSGKCQAVVLANNMDPTTEIIGLDAQYLYYQDNIMASLGDPSYDARRIGKSATNGSGTLVFTGDYRENYNGVVGSTTLLMTNAYPKLICNVTTTSSCASSLTQLETVGNYDWIISFRGMAPDSFSFYDWAGDLTVGWVSPTGASLGTFSETGGTNTYSSFASSGTAAYWIRQSGGDLSLFATKASDPTTRVKVAGNLTSSMSIADANGQSVLLWDGDAISRVPVVGASTPVALITVSPAPSVLAATEDASGVYWFDGNGNLNRCTASGCSGSKTTLVTGQAPKGGLSQDTTSLYWVDSSSGYRLMRIAK